MLYSRRGRAYARLGRWNEAVADYSQAIELRPAQEALWKYERLFSARADLYAEMGRWRAAASDFSESCKFDPGDVEARIGLILISLANDDQNGFRELCARLLRGFRPSHETDLVVKLVRACTSAAIDARDGEMVLRLAELTSYTSGQGAAEFRVGKFQDVVTNLTAALPSRDGEGDSVLDGGGVESGSVVSSETIGRGASARLFLALAHQRLGHINEARQFLHEATSVMDERARPDPTPDSSRPRLGWRDRVVFGALRREAKAVILYDPVFPADPFAH
jgi:tetratricopeptide (TPR) repeat protein